MHADEDGTRLIENARCDLEDFELLAAISSGSRDAFEVLYERHSRPLLHFLSRTLDDQGLAEEIVQDTFLAIWRKPSFNAQSSVRTWIFAIARRRFRDGSRRARLEIVPELADHPSREIEPEASALARATGDEIAREIAALSRIQKEVLYLAIIEQLSHTEMALVLGIPVGTVKSRLDSAKRHLYVRLDQLGGMSSDVD